MAGGANVVSGSDMRCVQRHAVESGTFNPVRTALDDQRFVRAGETLAALHGDRPEQLVPERHGGHPHLVIAAESNQEVAECYDVNEWFAFAGLRQFEETRHQFQLLGVIVECDGELTGQRIGQP